MHAPTSVLATLVPSGAVASAYTSTQLRQVGKSPHGGDQVREVCGT
ncbi:hypothetical protein [Saccharopolyspora hattusasensis]